MKWYVSQGGEVTGPMDATEVRRAIERGTLKPGVHVRDEGGQWMPVEQSPFGTLFAPAAPQQASGGGGGGAWIVIFLFVVLPIGFLFYSAQSCSDHVKKEEAKRETDRERRKVESTKAEQSRSEQELNRAWPRYQALKDAVASDPPTTLGDLYELMGTPDQCKPTADGDFDTCFWFLTPDSRLKVFSYSMGPGDVPNSSPRAWVKEVIFAKDGKLDHRIGGAIKQMIDAGGK